MANIDIDTGKAAQWLQDVKSELKAVENLLKEVRASTTEVVGSDDFVFQLLEKTGKVMESTWTKTCKAFETGWNGLEKGIKALVNAGAEIDDDVKRLINQISGQ